ncbi:MAG: ABC transporter permease [Ilumatobacteraceae bacterium]
MLVLRPLFQIQRRAITDGAAGYKAAYIDDPFIGEAIRTTILLTLGSLVIALVLGTSLAWIAFRLPRRLRWMAVFPVMPIVIPTAASVTGWIFLFAPRIGYGNAVLRWFPWWSDVTRGPIDVYTLPWIVLNTGIGLAAFVYLFISSGLAGINGELLESAEICGSSKLGAFFRVTLPLLRPSLVYATAISLLLGLGQFTGPLLLGRTENVRVLTTQMLTHMSESPVNFNAAAGIGAPLMVIGLIFVLAQRKLLGNQDRFVTHGAKGFRPTGRTSRVGVIALGIYGLIAAILPLTALLIVALSPRWSAEFAPSDFTLEHFREAFETDNVTTAIRNSITYSMTAAAIVIPLGFVCASILVRGRRVRVLRSALDYLVAMPLGIPAVVFGVGFLFAYSGPPLDLYGTKWVMIVVYITLMLPFVTRMQASGMISLGSQYFEASRVAGAGGLRTTAQIVLPLMRNALGATAALTFIILSHEFGASLLVRSPTTQVLGTALYDALTLGAYSEVAVLALVMTGVVLAGLGVAFLLGGRSVLNRL